jgi:hypothetical protein
MVRFGISDCPVFLSWSLPVLLVVGTPVTTVSCVVASVNPQQVLTIPGESALVVESMDRTTPPKVDKADTSSTEVTTA